MNIGVPAEIKPDERRVALTPGGARELVRSGHRVLVQAGAGDGAGFFDDDYRAAGAEVVGVDEAWGEADLVVKVKEPQPGEVERLRPEQTLFAYLHLAAEPALAAGLRASGATCIAYETVQDAAGRLPLLAPMSAIAGRLAAQVGAATLTAPAGGRGVLPGGIPGVAPAEVLIIGGGVAGANAAAVAVGMGAGVTVLDRDVARLGWLEERFGGRVRTLLAGELQIEALLPRADLVIGAVLVSGARAPRVVRRGQLGLLRAGSVLVDISIDQGGCFETSRPTTHSQPTFTVDGVVHYCVTNMPGAVPVTSTAALTAATFAYVARLADLGVDRAIEADPALAAGVNVRAGEVVHPTVAAALEGTVAA